MHMRILDRRVHLLLDEQRYSKVHSEATRQGESVAAVIRRAIDQLPADPGRRVTAINAILAAPRVAVPIDPADLRRELDRERDRTP